MEGTNDYRNEGHASPASQSGYARLAAAIMAKAAKEARAGDQDALFWLLTPQAEFIAEEIGLSYTHVLRKTREFFK